MKNIFKRIKVFFSKAENKTKDDGFWTYQPNREYFFDDNIEKSPLGRDIREPHGPYSGY